MYKVPLPATLSTTYYDIQGLHRYKLKCVYHRFREQMTYSKQL